MCPFIDGHTSTGARVANATVESRSSAIPVASLAITFAVAGAMRRTSADSARRMWPISDSSVRSNRERATGCLESVCNVRGVTNSSAARERITRTLAPALSSARTRSGALYAAMPPVTPRRIVLPETLMLVVGSGRGLLRRPDVLEAYVLAQQEDNPQDDLGEPLCAPDDEGVRHGVRAAHAEKTEREDAPGLERADEARGRRRGNGTGHDGDQRERTAHRRHLQIAGEKSDAEDAGDDAPEEERVRENAREHGAVADALEAVDETLQRRFSARAYGWRHARKQPA